MIASIIICYLEISQMLRKYVILGKAFVALSKRWSNSKRVPESANLDVRSLLFQYQDHQDSPDINNSQQGDLVGVGLSLQIYVQLANLSSWDDD